MAALWPSGHNALMLHRVRRYRLWILVWCGFTVLGALLIARQELAHLRDAFDTDARIVHRLLSQRVVQHDAVLATLALLQPPPEASSPEQRLPSLYPQILSVHRRDRGVPWADSRLQAAEAQSRQWQRPALASADLPGGRYQLVLASDPASFALRMDLHAVVPWNEWPMPPDTSPVRVTLEHEGQAFVVQPGRLGGHGWRFAFHKHLAADSQPFDVVALRDVAWHELPWIVMLAWALAVAAALAGLHALLRQRERRQRAEELLRLGQVARLNTLGELAAGMAHEINQPLTAVLANTQAAQRLLGDDPPELDTARLAMAQATEQARRAADVVGRLRRAVTRPDAAAPLHAVVLQDTVRNALHLLAPELERRGVQPELQGVNPPVQVLAEPVGLEQIIHNLLMNALQALEQVPASERRLVLAFSHEGTPGAQGARGVLTLTDTGPGIAPEALPRLFEPFFSTRADGLGLGLSLCETLANRMGASLSADHHSPRGARLRLALPLATA